MARACNASRRARNAVGLRRRLRADRNCRRHIPALDLLPVGAHRRDWVRTLLSDGFVFVRHADLDTTAELSDRVGVELQMYAG